MATIGSETAAKMTAELQRKMPIDQAQHYDLVIENDLAGRALLAVLWEHRAQLTVHLLTEEPTATHVAALKSALETVRNAPDVSLISPDDARQLVTSSDHLIWSIDVERTHQRVHNALQRRNPAQTFTPLFAGFEMLGGNRPDQTQPAHELILRNVIRDHARFLNFFGDRFNPDDLYQRSKYPRWLTPPEGFDAALPQVWFQLVDPEDKVLDRREFSGTLHFEAREMKQENRLVVDFGPLVKIFNTTLDLTIWPDNTLGSHNGLRLQVHRDKKLVSCTDLTSGAAQPQIRLSAVRPGSSVSVSVVATQEHPVSQESCAIQLQLMAHPLGTHPAPNLLARFKAWLTRVPASD